MTGIIVSIVILLVLLIAGIALPLVFFAATIFMVLLSGVDSSFVIPYGYAKINSLTILIVPLFMIAGAFMESSGIGASLMNFSERLVGRIKGGVGVASVVACAIFGAISGSANAALTSLSPVCFPKLYEAGYREGEACSLLASSSILGCLIPPSGMMILYAWTTNTSVLACFLASLAPGLVLTVVFSVINIFMARKMDVKKLSKEEYKERFSNNKFMDLKTAFALFMPVFVLGSIYGGIMTPTEAAALSAVYAFLVGVLVYRNINIHNIGPMLAKCGKMAGVIMLLIFSVTILSRLYIDAGLPDMVYGLLTGITDNQVIMLILINIFLAIIGMLMDDASGIVLAAPLLAPVVQQLGVDMVHFAAIVGVNLSMGGITPPTAPMMYLAGKLGHGTFAQMLIPSFKFLVFGWIPVLILTTYCEDFALFFPRLFLGY